MEQQGEFKVEDLWSAISVGDPNGMITIAAGIIKDHNEAQQKANRPMIPDNVVRDGLEVIGVFIDYFQVWERAHEGIDIREVDRMLLGPSVKLDMCNDTWKQVLQHVARPTIMNCIGYMQQARILYANFVTSRDPNERERILETVWSLLARRFDFVSWVVFMLTSDSERWSQCQISCIKIAQGGDLPTFKKRFTG